jgi:hypothetical protein
LVGKLAAELAGVPGTELEFVGYVPREMPSGTALDDRYDRFVHCRGRGFSPDQPLRMWEDAVARGVPPGAIALLGVGGGDLAAFEYRLALALGAQVGLVAGSGGAADGMLEDPLWTRRPGLRPLQCDSSALSQFMLAPERRGG